MTTTQYQWGTRSRSLLVQLHPDLQRVAERFITLTPRDCTILDTTIRTVDQQVEYVRTGASKTYASKHLSGHALDFAPLVDGQVTWKMSYYDEVLPFWTQAAKEEGVAIRLGRFFKGFVDAVHVELDGYQMRADVYAELKKRGLIR